MRRMLLFGLTAMLGCGAATDSMGQQGPVGPAGPIGPQGPAGAAGAACTEKPRSTFSIGGRWTLEVAAPADRLQVQGAGMPVYMATSAGQLTNFSCFVMPAPPPFRFALVNGRGDTVAECDFAAGAQRCSRFATGVNVERDDVLSLAVASNGPIKGIFDLLCVGELTFGS